MQLVALPLRTLNDTRTAGYHADAAALALRIRGNRDRAAESDGGGRAVVRRRAAGGGGRGGGTGGGGGGGGTGGGGRGGPHTAPHDRRSGAVL